MGQVCGTSPTAGPPAVGVARPAVVVARLAVVVAVLLVALGAAGCGAGRGPAAASSTVAPAAGSSRSQAPATAGVHGAATTVAARAVVPIQVGATASGPRLGGDFLGLALEAWSLSRDQFVGSDLASYMRLLGPHGLLRIGGNSLDESFWTSSGEHAPAWATEGTIEPASLRALKRTLLASGWRVILGVNLKHSSPARAVDEARYAKRILGSRLAAIEIGNEPDHYGISEPAFFAAFERDARAIHAALGPIAISGPETASHDLAWVSDFARQEAPHPDIALLTGHEYPLSACGRQPPTIAQLLSSRSLAQEVGAARTLAAAARRDHVPAVVDETNSVVCWGQPGVSNVFAATLWTLDYALALADHGIAVANFQGRIRGCRPYIPLCTAPGGTRLLAQPDFYGLLAVRQVGTGTFLPVRNPAAAQLRVYALANDPHRTTVVLDNLGPARTVALTVPGHPTHGRRMLLMTRSPRGLSAHRAISLGGRQVQPGGRFATPLTDAVAVTTTRAGARVRLAVGAHSATILRLF